MRNIWQWLTGHLPVLMDTGDVSRMRQEIDALREELRSDHRAILDRQVDLHNELSNKLDGVIIDLRGTKRK